jgi:hypothetical protein
MDIRKIELMKSLQREYYGELRRRKGSPQEVLVYRLVVMLLLGILLGFLFH